MMKLDRPLFTGNASDDIHLNDQKAHPALYYMIITLVENLKITGF